MPAGTNIWVKGPERSAEVFFLDNFLQTVGNLLRFPRITAFLASRQTDLFGKPKTSLCVNVQMDPSKWGSYWQFDQAAVAIAASISCRGVAI